MKNKKNTFVTLLLMAILCLSIYGVFFAETANAGGGGSATPPGIIGGGSIGTS
jgi:hypothetical protein